MENDRSVLIAAACRVAIMLIVVKCRKIAAAAGLQPFDLTDRGPVQEAYAECFAPALPSAVAVRELAALARAHGWSGEQLRTPAVRQNEGPGNAG